MTVRAVVLPGTPLLVPGAAGNAQVLVGSREAALTALRRLVDGLVSQRASSATTVAVVAPGASSRRGPARASLAAVGVADAWLDAGWAATARAATAEAPVAGTAASIGLLALAGAGWEGDVDVVELDDADLSAARELGADLARQGTRIVVVRDPRSAAPDAVLTGFGAAPDGGRRHVATGEYEQHRYEVRWYDDHALSSPGPLSGSVSR
ncbi:hypothetical protein [Cellulosimicrobium protaetiae]|uniref:Uncharacterized protein n=1 Tax=Cellulosimicrobium protaetiae TaxID=2587808 RepID=A0A6M5UG54_9MICO|nr:hypothetical protein [Cellulosimicrobium protaetiae]QJW37054.1 hypothetical protein FIC82_013550 [Cellulosimicrobium protaetiae]